MVSTRKLLLLKVQRWKYYNAMIEERLSQLKLLDMLVHGETEKLDFSSAQVCSNDYVLS